MHHHDREQPSINFPIGDCVSVSQCCSQTNENYYAAAVVEMEASSERYSKLICTTSRQ